METCDFCRPLHLEFFVFIQPLVFFIVFVFCVLVFLSFLAVSSFIVCLDQSWVGFSSVVISIFSSSYFPSLSFFFFLNLTKFFFLHDLLDAVRSQHVLVSLKSV